jgi:hypothetical protein
MTDTAHPKYGQRYEEALSYAALLHATQLRKSDETQTFAIPYVAHLLEVSALVWMGGGNEDQAIAGLLHDAIEDQSDRTSPEEIERRFGRRVRNIVLACSDGAPDMERGRATWLERKVAYLAALYRTDHRPAIIVTVADKISNARAIVDDLLLAGDSVEAAEAFWGRFNAPRHAIAWYYAEVLAAAQHWDGDNPLVTRLDPLVHQIAEHAGGTDVGAAFDLRPEELTQVLARLDKAKLGHSARS